MRLIFWGTPKYAAENLQSIINAGHEITAVVTQPDKKRGRGNKLSPSPVKEIAELYDIPVYTTQSISKDLKTKEKILDLKTDLYLVVAFGQILPSEILKQPEYGCWNSHASLLPKWRGAAPIQWSILNGDIETGVCIMAMEEGLDTGPVIKKEVLPISYTDNLEDLNNKLCKLSAKLILNSLLEIEGTKGLDNKARLLKLKAIDQSKLNLPITYARQIKKDDYRLDWNIDSIKIYNKIRGLYPNAYTYYNGKRVKIIEADIIKNINNISTKYNEYIIPGQIIEVNKMSGILVRTKDKSILIKSAQLEGKSKTDGYTLSKQCNMSVMNSFSNSNN